MVTINFLKKKRIYLDNASSTPIDTEVQKVFSDAQNKFYGNRSAFHTEGFLADTELLRARTQIGEALGARAEEIYFTNGGTESDNLAVLGVVKKAQESGILMPHILVSEIEHSAILEPVKKLQKSRQILLEYIPVDATGLVDPKDVKKLLRDTTVFVSVLHANNEVGTIEPIREIAKVVRHFRKEKTSHNQYPVFHTDACQSFVYEKVKVEQLGVELLSINSNKLYGPKGVGALFVKNGTPISPLLYGGNQEKELRPGTENVPAISAFAHAVYKNEKMKEKESARLRALRDFFIIKLTELFPGVQLHGHKEMRLANNVNITIPDTLSEFLVVALDSRGIAVSEKSACKSNSGEGSHVLKALYKNTPIAEEEGSLRFSFGRSTTKNDLLFVLEQLKDIYRIQYNKNL